METIDSIENKGNKNQVKTKRKNKKKNKNQNRVKDKKVKKKKLEEPLREIHSLFDMELFKNIPKDTFDHDIVFARFILFMRKSIIHKKRDYCIQNNIRSRRNMYVKDEDLDSIVAECNTEESAIRNLINSKNRSIIKLALNSLTLSQRYVIIYFYYENMNIDEIAKELNLKPRGVYALKSRAEERLKRLYSYYGDGNNV